MKAPHAQSQETECDPQEPKSLVLHAYDEAEDRDLVDQKPTGQLPWSPLQVRH